MENIKNGCKEMICVESNVAEYHLDIFVSNLMRCQLYSSKWILTCLERKYEFLLNDKNQVETAGLILWIKETNALPYAEVGSSLTFKRQVWRVHNHRHPHTTGSFSKTIKWKCPSVKPSSIDVRKWTSSKWWVFCLTVLFGNLAKTEI